MLVALCAVTGFSATSAFALEFTTGQWLVNNARITANQSADTEGELLFENLLNTADILCSGLFEGTIGANGVDEVTKVFSLEPNQKEIPELDPAEAGTGIKCTAVKLCEPNPEIWPVNLPFKTQLDLDTTEEKWFDLILKGGKPGEGLEFPAYTILCKVLGVNVEELCEAVEGFGELSNNAAMTDVESLGAITPEGLCNGNAEDGLIENNAENVALITVLSGTLQVSE